MLIDEQVVLDTRMMMYFECLSFKKSCASVNDDVTACNLGLTSIPNFFGDDLVKELN